jgi:hypothetical protein
LDDWFLAQNELRDVVRSTAAWLWSEVIMSVSPTEGLLERIRAEYLEMPGLCLTSGQMQRLCGVEHMLCQMVLDSLVDAKFLYLKPNGAYARLTDGAIPRPRAARAHVKPDNSKTQTPFHASFQNRPRMKPTRSA